MHIFKNPNYDFLRWRWHAIALSWVVILAGVVSSSATKGMPKGVEFSGGTVVILKFDQTAERRAGARRARSHLPGRRRQRHRAAVRRSVAAAGDGPGPQYGAESGARAELDGRAGRAPRSSRPTSGTSRVAGTEIVGPTVGKELQTRGTLATVFALAGILAYLAFRFQFSFAVGAVVATIHDLLITLAFLAFFRYDLTLNVIAAILTMTGYSTNDTIVIFDRIRENLRSMRRDDLARHHQRLGQPDARPDDHHRWPDAAVGDRAVSSSAARCSRASRSR